MCSSFFSWLFWRLLAFRPLSARTFPSYGIAIYSTVWLEQVYTMSELSAPAIQTILGTGFLKVLENVAG